MSPTYKRLLVAVDAGLLLYWAAVFLNLIPEHLRFKDYSNQVIQAWNWSFFPLGRGCRADRLPRRPS